MSQHRRAASSVSSFETDDNQIERIGGVHLDGDRYFRLGWDIQYFSSQEINHILLKMFLEGRFRSDGYGLSLIGHAMYQLWSPESLTQDDIDSCRKASRDLDNMYRVINCGESKGSNEQHQKL